MQQPLTDLVVRAQRGDVEAYARLVEATQRMVHGVALSVLRDSTTAQDAAQQAYLRAFRRLSDLQEPASFAGWLRRIVITVAFNMRRARRVTFVTLDDIPDVPVLDESESRWSEAQRHRLASALLSLTPEERQLCDRRYHGQWTTARLAAQAGVDEAAMRKRLQRIRDKLRKEMEVSEQRGIRPEDIMQDLPARVVELLAHPRLTDLPENPVGKTLDALRGVYADFTEQGLPEVVDLAEARKTIGNEGDVRRSDRAASHRRRTDSALRPHVAAPAHGALRGEATADLGCGQGIPCRQGGRHAPRGLPSGRGALARRARTAGFVADDRTRTLNPSIGCFPAAPSRLCRRSTRCAASPWRSRSKTTGDGLKCSPGASSATGIVRHLGGDPERHIAVGVGYGLERLAMLRYGIDDIRRVEVASVA